LIDESGQVREEHTYVRKNARLVKG